MKHSYEYIKSEFEKKGYILLEEEYVSNKINMKYKCLKCNNINEISYNKLQQNRGCPVCYGNKKHSYEFIKQEFEKKDYVLLSTEYKNAHTKMKYLCKKCNNVNYIKYNDLQQNHGCPNCFGNIKRSYEFIKQEFNNAGYILLETEYINNRTKMKYKCDKGHISYIRYGSFKKGHRCPLCANIKKSESKKLTYEFVKNEFENHGYILLDIEYINANTKMKYLCKKCNSINYITYSNLQQNHGCSICAIKKRSKKQRHIFDFIKSEFEKRNFELLELFYLNNKFKMKCKCKDCNTILYKNYNNLQNHGCRICFLKRNGLNRKGNKCNFWNPNREQVKNREIYYRKSKQLLKDVLKKLNIKKESKTYKLLGYDGNQLLQHLESFSNWNEIKEQSWHIDHIIPVKAFIEHGIKNLKVINHLSNLQPLLAEENLRKSCKYNKEDFEKYINSEPIKKLLLEEQDIKG